MDQWKPISSIRGYEHFTNYEMDITGQLRNIKTGNHLKWCLSGNRYLCARISNRGQNILIHQHRMIACLFIQNTDNKEHVDHINGNTCDNSIENLRWATRGENMRNMKQRIDNMTGEHNISKIIKNGEHRWMIRICKNGKQYVKTFPRNLQSDIIPIHIITYRDKMKYELHGEFA